MSGQTDNHVDLFFDEIVIDINQNNICFIYLFQKNVNRHADVQEKNINISQGNILQKVWHFITTTIE